jgi:hypothetical protein
LDHFRAYKAIDNIIAGETNMSHTSYELCPWWEVDLIDDYIIDEIVIWNRIYPGDDTVENRLFPFTLYILENDRSVAWSESITQFQNTPLVFSIPDVVGGLQLDRRAERLETSLLYHLTDAEIRDEIENAFPSRSKKESMPG